MQLIGSTQVSVQNSSSPDSWHEGPGSSPYSCFNHTHIPFSAPQSFLHSSVLTLWLTKVLPWISSLLSTNTNLFIFNWNFTNQTLFEKYGEWKKCSTLFHWESNASNLSHNTLKEQFSQQTVEKITCWLLNMHKPTSPFLFWITLQRKLVERHFNHNKACDESIFLIKPFLVI